MASSMNALNGPLHGRANQSCLEFVLRGGTSDPVEVEQFVRGNLQLAVQSSVWSHSPSSRRPSSHRSICARKICPDDENCRLFEPTRSCSIPLKIQKSPIQTPTSISPLVAPRWTQGPKDYTLLWLGKSCRYWSQIFDERVVVRK